MEAVRVSCPKCGKELRLRDRSLIGKKGKCPKCTHRFLLREKIDQNQEDEVTFELAESPQTLSPSRVPNAVKGVVVDQANDQANAEDEVPMTLVMPGGDSQQQAPLTAQNASPATAPVHPQQPQPPQQPYPQQVVYPPQQHPQQAHPQQPYPQYSCGQPPMAQPGFPDPYALPAGHSVGVQDNQRGVDRIREIKRRHRKRLQFTVLSVAMLCLLIGGGYFAYDRFGTEPPPTDAEKPRMVDNRQWDSSRTQQQKNLEFAASHSPTNGDPIRLQLIPAGTSIVFHLRPADIWREGSVGQEVLWGLPVLAEWGKQKIQEICRYEPQEIEEALVCVALGAKEEPFEVATVVKLVNPMQNADFINRFRAERANDLGGPSHPVYYDETHAYYKRDERTIAICEKRRASEMMASIVREKTHSMSQGLVEILQHTDCDRHFTIAFHPKDIRIHKEELINATFVPFLEIFLDWIGDGAEAVAWSCHLGPRFYTDMKVRNYAYVPEVKLQREFRNKLDVMPREILNLVQKMQPKQNGRRAIIGRYPAMMKLLSLRTLGGIDQRYVQLTAVMNERAAPNLAVGTMLFLDEAAVTDFTQTVPTPATPGNLPARLADRLQRVFEIDFRRTPLQEAYAFIADETKVPIEIDGDALKMAGMTKNMAQTHQLGNVPATEALKSILSRYTAEGMILIVDESTRKATVLTKAAAASRNVDLNSMTSSDGMIYYKN